MEEILNKNIFNNDDLAKLSPDYIPSNILLRIQSRRQMVKDTHNHICFKTNTGQRKVLKRYRPTYTMNREIAKIRNGFQKVNLKNQILLRKAIQNIDTMKNKDLSCNNADESKDDIESFLNSFHNDANNTELVISNKEDFLLKPKPNVIKRTQKETKIHKRMKPTSLGKAEQSEEDLRETILRIECKHTNYQNFDYYENSPKVRQDLIWKESKNDIVVNENATDLIQKEYKNEILVNETVTLAETSPNDKKYSKQNGIDSQIAELRSLLLMMAISPKQNQNEHLESEEISNSKINVVNKNELSSKISTSTLTSVTKGVNLTDCLDVKTITVEINSKQKILMKKYVEKWKSYMGKRKNYLYQQRQETLNNFFDKLHKKKTCCLGQSPIPTDKAKLIASDLNRYQHRYKMQKHIIALQKVKLEEQRRIIEELKYNKLLEASNQTVNVLKEEVRKTYHEIDRQLKPKIKCLTNELKLPEMEETLMLNCLKVPQFLQRMEKRAREREEKHAMIRERRKQMEEERIRLKQQEELAKAAMDKEEKLKRMQELKVKRKKEKIESIRKKQHAERMRSLRVMADLHYEKSLMVKYGIQPLRLLIEIKRDNIEKAKAHYKFQLKKNVFLNWMWYTEDMWFERNYKAVEFWRKKLLRKCFDSLKKNFHGYVLKKQVAEDYYDLYVTQLVFRKFCEAIEIIRRENEIKGQKALLYYNSNLLFKTFTCWRTLPALNALKREQEARKARWREKVLQVVPDYTPPDD